MRVPMMAMLLASALLTGCATPQLWDSKPRFDTYRERISSVLVSQDGKTLVILGSDYHYIFEAPPAIVRTLTRDYQRYVEAGFGTFSVDESQRITGPYALHIRDDAPDSAKSSAKRAGFSEDALGTLRSDGVLTGTRYSAGNVRPEATARALNKEYYVNVRAPRPLNADLPRKLLLTPVAVLADGVIVIGTVALMVVALPIFAISR